MIKWARNIFEYIQKPDSPSELKLKYKIITEVFKEVTRYLVFSLYTTEGSLKLRLTLTGSKNYFFFVLFWQHGYKKRVKFKSFKRELSRGTFTLSEVSGRASAEKVAKLPNFEKWNQHDVTALQLTMVWFSRLRINFFLESNCSKTLSMIALFEWFAGKHRGASIGGALPLPTAGRRASSQSRFWHPKRIKFAEIFLDFVKKVLWK